MRSKFDGQLRQLDTALVEMGAMVEKAIADATKALIELDIALAQKIAASDDEIDNKEKEIESLCLKLILQHQPVARDLRYISSALKLITDLERIGDHAEDISEITILLAGRQYKPKLEHIPQMAEAAMKMVTESISAFVHKDVDLAKEVIAYDDIVDDLFEIVKDEMIERVKSDRSHGDLTIDLLMIAKYFERIGDHATNIAEWVVFSHTGTHVANRTGGARPDDVMPDDTLPDDISHERRKGDRRQSGLY